MAYKGTNYRGWQRQKFVPSVQQTIEEKIIQLLRRDIYIHGCGRTDAGVHASQFFAHIDLELHELEKIERLNMVLPNDIVIKDIFKVEANKSAQLDAVSRAYQYNIHFHKNPFITLTSALYDHRDYDLEKMEKAFYLIGEATDFFQFCKTVKNYKTTDCKIFDLTFNKSATSNTIHLKIKANRFLRGMIRYLVGDLLALGTGRLKLEKWEGTLQNKQERKEKFLAHPQGLSLIEVKY